MKIPALSTVDQPKRLSIVVTKGFFRRISLISFGLTLLLTSALAADRAPPPAPPPPPPGGYPAFDPNKLSDSDRCALMSGGADRANAKMPTAISEGIQAIHISNNCKIRVYEINFNVAADLSAVSKEWQAFMQQRVNDAACTGKLSGPLVRHGWRFSHVYNFKDGKRFLVTAKCAA